MKIAVVSPYDYAYPGGVVVHINNLYRELKELGSSVRIITPYSGNIESISNNDVIPVGKPVPIPSGGSVARVTLSPFLTSTLQSILERERFDVVHLHEPLCSSITLTALYESNTINVGTFHACHKASVGYKMTSPVLQIFFNRLHGKIAVSKPAKDFVSRYFLPSDFTIIPNGIDIEYFSSPIMSINNYRDGKLNILFVGRMEKRKGLKYLIQAFEIVKREMPNTRLIVVGPGDRRIYEQMVRKAGLEDVVFTGYVTNDELPPYYHLADVFCSPATGEESFGIILLEAMAASKPVVASSISGYKSVMTDGVEGLMAPPKNVPALADALIRVLKDEPLRRQFSIRGRETAERYSWPNVAKSVYEYYLSLLDAHASKKIKMVQ